jgi:HEAT repeat protein
MFYRNTFFYTLLAFAIICLNTSNVSSEELTQNESIDNEELPDKHNVKPTSFRTLYDRIYSGKANLNEVKQALTSKDTTQLVNAIHALYAMKWHIGVRSLLYKMWRKDMESTPDINWELIEIPQVRIALASTINRIDRLKSKTLRDYIRTFKYDDNDLNRGQVIVALGLNGDPADVPYLEEMADSDNRYLTQIGVSSLAFMGNETAKNSLISLAKKHYSNPRGKLILEVLSRAYDVTPINKEQADAEERIN